MANIQEILSSKSKKHNSIKPKLIMFFWTIVFLLSIAFVNATSSQGNLDTHSLKRIEIEQKI